MKSNSLLVIIIALFISNLMFAQVQWPFPEENTQASMVGSIGEIRGGGNRFHKGADLTNGTNYSIHAINSGIVTWNNSGGNWGQGGSYIRVGDVYYYHCQPSNSILNNPNPVTVNVGDYIGEMITSGSIHVHLQENNTNYLNGNLTPYTDTHAPEVIRTRFSDGFSLYKNGIRYNTSNSQQDNLELNSIINFESEDYHVIFSKIDIAADIEDRRVGPTGASTGGRTSPFAYTYQLQNYNNPNENNPLYEYELTFDRVPNNSASHMVLHPQSVSPGVISTHIITSHPRDTPYDRFFRTNIRAGVTETWMDSDNAALNARHISEAAFPDKNYRLYIDAYDVDYNDNSNNHIANVIDVPIIIDNFLPYITKVEVTNSNGSILYYRSGLTYNSITNTLSISSNQISEEIPQGARLKYKVYVSELLSSLRVTIDNSDYPLQRRGQVGSEYEYWETDIINIATNTFKGIQLLKFNGEDIAGNNLLTNPAVLPVKLENGQWSNSPVTGEDVRHSIKISETSSTTFEVDFNAGDFCSPNGNRNFIQKMSSSDCLEICFLDASTSADGITSWYWEFGDFNNSTSSQQNPTFKYNTAGTYTVKLTVTNTQNQTKSSTKTITVEECVSNINAVISSSTTAGEVPLLVNLSDLSTGDIFGRKWNISPISGVRYISGTPNSKNPKVSFDQKGTYSISLDLENEDGTQVRSNIITVNVTSSSNVDVTVDFTTQGQIYTGNQIGFISQVSDGCNQFDYQWTFSDYNGNHYATTPNPTYVFPVPGSYNVKLCVTDNCGNHSCKTKVINVANYVSNVSAKMSTSADNKGFVVKKGERVTFWDVSTPKANILYGSWFWDYKEGASGPDHFYYYPRSGNPIYHTFDKIGTYRVRLYVGENATHFGSYAERVITVIDEHAYLDIPAINESSRQVIKGVKLDKIQTRNFDGFMAAHGGVPGSGEPAVYMFKKSIKNGRVNWDNIKTLYLNSLINDPNWKVGYYSIGEDIGYGDEVFVKNMFNDRSGPIRYRLNIYTYAKLSKTYNDWSNPIKLVQSIETRPGEVITGWKTNGSILAVGWRYKLSNGKTVNDIKLYQKNIDGKYVYKATLSKSDRVFVSNGGSTNEVGGIGEFIDMSNEAIVTSTGYRSVKKVYIYEKPDLGWSDMTESKQLTSVSRLPSNNNILSNAKIFGNTILTNTNFSNINYSQENDNNDGVYIFQKTNAGWRDKNEKAFLSNYRSNVEDYHPFLDQKPVPISNAIFGKRGDFILCQGSSIRDYETFNDSDGLYHGRKSLVLFYRSGTGWNNQLKESFRLYPSNAILPESNLLPSTFDENNSEVTQLNHYVTKDPKSGVSVFDTVIYTYDLKASHPDNNSICSRDIVVENQIIHQAQPGAEGKNIIIKNTTVNSGGGVLYQATESIILKPDTHIKSGGYFRALQVDCNLINQ